MHYKGILMKIYGMIALLCFCSASQAMRWIEDDAPSKEAIEAFKILGIQLPNDIVETNNLIQKHYFKNWKEISEGKDVLDVEGKKISAEKLENFLDYVDENTVRSSLEYKIIPSNTIAILPSASIDQKTNVYIFALLKKYIKLVGEVIIFTANEKSQLLVTDLFKETFKDFNVDNMQCLITQDEKNIAQSCATQLNMKWKESKTISPYIIVSHWGPFNDSIKDILCKDYKENYIGSELQPVPQNEAMTMYGNGKNGYASAKLREASIEFFNAIQKKNSTRIGVSNKL